MFACKFSSADFLLYSPKNNGTILLTTVKKNKDFIEKINTKSWQYFENVLFPEFVTCRLDDSLENNQKIYCFCRKLSFGIWLHVTTQNANLSGFIIPVLTLLWQLKGNGIAKIEKKGKIKNKHDLTTISSWNYPKPTEQLVSNRKIVFHNVPLSFHTCCMLPVLSHLYIIRLPGCFNITVMPMNK